jgi:hypothetical protein
MTYTCDKKNRIHPPGEFMLGTKMHKENDGLESATTVEYQNFASYKGRVDKK